MSGNEDLMSSLDKYVGSESLVEDNQLYIDNFGLQDVLKHTQFIAFPPVLFLQLKRFTYDSTKNDMVKVCSK